MYSGTKQNKSKSIVIIVIAVLVIIGAVGAVIGVGSNGFRNWNTKTWFKSHDGSRVVMDIKSLDDLVGVTYKSDSDWTLTEILDNEGNTIETAEEGAVMNWNYLSALCVGTNSFSYEAGDYDFTIKINGHVVKFENIAVSSVEDSSTIAMMVCNKDYESVNIEDLEAASEEVSEADFIQIGLFDAAVLGEEEELQVPGASLIVVSGFDAVESFEILSINKSK